MSEGGGEIRVLLQDDSIVRRVLIDSWGKSTLNCSIAGWRGALVTLVVAASLTGCASTKLLDVWQDESYSGGPISKVLVIAIANDERNRRIFEDSFAKAFREKEVEAVPGYSLLPADAASQKEAIATAIQGKGFDAVVISHNAGVDEETVHYPGTVRTESWGTGGYGPRSGWDGHYRRTWETTQDPGYTTKYTTIFIETSIYETANENLIWSARSESYDPGSVLEIIDGLSKEVIASMQKGGLL